MKSIKTNKQNFLQKYKGLAVIAVIALVGSITIFKSFAATSENLQLYFPNATVLGASKNSSGYQFFTKNFLEGKNYIPASPSAAVLWFEDVGGGKFKMYNSNPAAPSKRCHWDLFKWTSTKLQYEETLHDCGDSPKTHIVYSPGITYMPKTWNGTAWSESGVSTANFYVNNQLKCTGSNNWSSTIPSNKVDLLDGGGMLTIHAQSTQTNTWNPDSGTDSYTGCGPGVVQRYQDNHYLYDKMPVTTGGVMKGVKRTVGGSLDRFDTNGKWDWDIWMDAWKPLTPQQPVTPQK